MSACDVSLVGKRGRRGDSHVARSRGDSDTAVRRMESKVPLIKWGLGGDAGDTGGSVCWYAAFASSSVMLQQSERIFDPFFTAALLRPVSVFLSCLFLIPCNHPVCRPKFKSSSAAVTNFWRSEERRVGKEFGCGWWR